MSQNQNYFMYPLKKWWTAKDEDQQKLFDKWKDDVKTFLTICKNGETPYTISKHFYEEFGTDIPFRDIGFNSLTDFFYHIDDIFECREMNGKVYLFINNLEDDTKHLRDLVKCQRDPRIKTQSYYSYNPVPSYWTSKPVPSYCLYSNHSRIVQLNPYYPRPTPQYFNNYNPNPYFANHLQFPQRTWNQNISVPSYPSVSVYQNTSARLPPPLLPTPTYIPLQRPILPLMSHPPLLPFTSQFQNLPRPLSPQPLMNIRFSNTNTNNSCQPTNNLSPAERAEPEPSIALPKSSIKFDVEVVDGANNNTEIANNKDRRTEINERNRKIEINEKDRRIRTEIKERDKKAELNRRREIKENDRKTAMNDEIMEFKKTIALKLAYLL